MRMRCFKRLVAFKRVSLYFLRIIIIFVFLGSNAGLMCTKLVPNMSNELKGLKHLNWLAVTILGLKHKTKVGQHSRAGVINFYCQHYRVSVVRIVESQ